MEDIDIFEAESLPEETALETADTDASSASGTIPDAENDGNAEASTPPEDGGKAEGEEQDGPAEEGTAAAGEASAAPAVTVKFDHQLHELTLEQASEYAKKGMNYDRLLPALDKLRFLAAAGEKSGLAELADSLIAEHNERLFQSLLGECEGNESVARRLYEAELEKQQKKYESALTAAKDEEQAASERLTKRLAEEFVQLQEMFPALEAFSKVPKSVVDTAVGQKVPLTDAYLRYRYAQDRQAKQAMAAQEKAKEASTGAVGNAPSGDDPALEAARMGIWS